jgi:DNA-binding NarL/FixJ family response regulator
MTTDQRVLKLWAKGYSSIQIAEQLGIAVSHVNLILGPTIEHHSEPI